MKIFRFLTIAFLSILSASALIAGSYYDSPVYSSSTGKAYMGIVGDFNVYDSTNSKNKIIVLSSTGGIVAQTNAVFSGSVTASNFLGDGSSLTNLSTGTLASKDYVLNATASLASIQYVQNATQALASKDYVASATSSLASKDYVSSATSSLVNAQYVANSTVPLANAQDVAISTAGLTIRVNNLDSSTQSITNINIQQGSRLDGFDLFKSTAEQKFNAIAISTTSTNFHLAGIDISTSDLQGQISDISNSIGQNNGIAELDSGGKVPISQLPNSIMRYLGNWNIITNYPPLEDGTGRAGDVYQVNPSSGSHDFGSGSIDFNIGDYAIFNGFLWEKSINSNLVNSVNGQQGIVTLVLPQTESGAANNFLTSYNATTGIFSKAAETDPVFISSAPSTYASFPYVAVATAPLANASQVSIATTTLGLQGGNTNYLLVDGSRDLTAAWTISNASITLTNGKLTASKATVNGDFIVDPASFGNTFHVNSALNQVLIGTSAITAGSFGIKSQNPGAPIQVIQNSFDSRILQINQDGNNQGVTIQGYAGDTTQNFSISADSATPNFFMLPVGIGIDSPSSQLHVLGDVKATSASFINTAGAGLIVSSSVYLATDGGNVGIGNTAPRSRLDLNSGAAEYLTDSQFITLGCHNTPGNSSGGIRWRGTYPGYTKISAAIEAISEVTNYRQGIAFFTEGTSSLTSNAVERMRITNTGTVGIGTTAPQAKLDIQGGALRVHGGGSTTNLEFKRADGWNPATISQLYDTTLYGGDLAFKVHPPDNTILTAPETVMYIKSDGNVGIGTTVPKERLDVNGRLFIDPINNAGGIPTSYASVLSSASLILSPLRSNSGASLRLAMGNGVLPKTGSWIQSIGNGWAAPLMLQPVSGNVGIGTDTPTQKLHVNGRISMDTWTADGDAVAYKDNATNSIALITSDKRLKQDIEPLSGVLENLSKLGTYTYRDLDEGDITKRKYGLISQELLENFPIATFKFYKEGEETEYYSVHYDKLTVLAIQAIKELKKKHEDEMLSLQEQIKMKIITLEERLSKLEKTE